MEKGQDVYVTRLGEGQQGNVTLWLADGHKLYARKTLRLEEFFIHKLKQSEDSQLTVKAKMLMREITVLNQTRHPNIIRLLGHSLVEKASSKIQVALDFEFCDQKSLDQFINKGGPRLSEGEIRFVLRQLTEALTEIHSNNVLHRDIKPWNIFLRSALSSKTAKTADVVLGDFGFCKDITQEPATTLLGTQQFVAPEIYFSNKAKEYDEKCDIWSLGATIYSLMFQDFVIATKPGGSASQLFEYEDSYIENRIENQIALSETTPAFSPSLCKLLCRMMRKNSSARPSGKEIRELLEAAKDVALPLPHPVMLGRFFFDELPSSSLPEQYAFDKNVLILNCQIVLRLWEIWERIKPSCKEKLAYAVCVVFYKAILDGLIHIKGLQKKVNKYKIECFNEFLQSPRSQQLKIYYENVIKDIGKLCEDFVKKANVSAEKIAAIQTKYSKPIEADEIKELEKEINATESGKEAKRVEKLMHLLSYPISFFPVSIARSDEEWNERFRNYIYLITRT